MAYLIQDITPLPTVPSLFTVYILQLKESYIDLGESFLIVIEK